MVSASVLRSLASKIARVSPRLPAQEVFHGRRPDPVPVLTHPSRPFSSSPTPPTGSTPPSTNQKWPALPHVQRSPFRPFSPSRTRSSPRPRNQKDLLTKVNDGLDCVATGMGRFVLFGGLIFTFGWLKPALEEIREGFAADARDSSNMTDEIIRDCQGLHDVAQKISDLKEIVRETKDLVPDSSSQGTQTSASSSRKGA